MRVPIASRGCGSACAPTGERQHGIGSQEKCCRSVFQRTAAPREHDWQGCARVLKDGSPLVGSSSTRAAVKRREYCRCSGYDDVRRTDTPGASAGEPAGESGAETLAGATFSPAADQSDSDTVRTSCRVLVGSISGGLLRGYDGVDRFGAPRLERQAFHDLPHEGLEPVA